MMHKRSVTIYKLCMYTWTVTGVTAYSFAAVTIEFLAWDVLLFRFFPLLFFLNKRGFLERFNFFPSVAMLASTAKIESAILTVHPSYC